jgi:hypothetical protein
MELNLESALRELNPPRQLGRLAPLPLGQGHVQRKERESNPQGSSLDCFRDSCHRQLACPSVRELRRQELNLRGSRLTDARNYQQLPLRNRVGAVGFEPTISCFRSRRNCQAFPYADEKRPAGVEPAHPPWQGSRLPLHHGRFALYSYSIVKELRAPGRTRTDVAALRVRNLGR